MSLKLKTGIFIDGRFRDAGKGGRFVRTRPMDGVDGYEAARGTAEDIDAAVASAKRAFDDKRWRAKEPLEKKQIMLKWAELVRAHGEELALLETYDVGKPISDAINVDVASCAARSSFTPRRSTRPMTRSRRPARTTAPSSTRSRSASSAPSRRGTIR